MFSHLAEIINYTEQTAFGMQQGTIAGICFTLGILLIYLAPAYKWILASVLLIFITPLALGGFWFSTGELGISDWDYYFSLHTGHRNTILEYKTIPFWNPYTCGGTAGLADPEFRFFTPTFIAQLIFGVPTGLRIAIFIATATGALGMLMLGKRLRLSVYAALLAAVGYAFGSANLLEVVEGHPNIFAAMWLPWIWWSWLIAYQYKERLSPSTSPDTFVSSESSSSLKQNTTWTKIRLKINSSKFGSLTWSLICGAFLAMTFFQGGIYLLMYTAIAFIVVPLLTNQPLKAVAVTLQAGIWALGLAAIKLIPVLLWLAQFQDDAYASSTYILPYLDKVLLGRILHGAEDIIPNQGAGWHEYGAYIGPFLLALSIVGIITLWKRHLGKTLFVSVLLTLILASSGPWLKPLFDEASFLPRSNISRIIIYTIIPLTLLAGFGLDYIRRRIRFGSIIAIIIVGIVAVDLMSLSYALSEQAFVLPRHAGPIEHAPYPIAYSTLDYKVRHEGVDHTRAYELIERGYGSLVYCSVLSPPPAVRTIHDEEDNEILSLRGEDHSHQSFELLEWTPNYVRARVATSGETRVMLNTNYAKGWYANSKPAQEMANRVGTIIPSTTEEVLFEYKTPGFKAGSTISGITLLAAALLLLYGKRYPMSPSRK